MLNLPNVTICGVDTRVPELALRALRHSMQSIHFGDAVLFTSTVASRQPGQDIRIVDIGVINSIERYSTFMLRDLGNLIRTEFALITQWDGFVLNPQAWTDEFLEYDYIGAPWLNFPSQLAVGNGGFSLRSSRLMHALLDPEMVIQNPEDLCICHLNRERLERNHGIRFAPLALAEKFAYENTVPSTGTFGFHGIANLADALSEDELEVLAERMTPDMVFGAGARRLIRAMVQRSYAKPARILLKKRMHGRDYRWHTLSLWPRLWWRQVLKLLRST